MKAFLERLGRAGWLASLLGLAPVVEAQVNGPHHGEPILVPASPSGFDMTWHGDLDTAYFVQFSTDLVTWEYLPFTHPDPAVEALLEGVMEGWQVLSEASALLLDGADLASVKSLLVEGGRLIAEYEQLVVADPAFSKMALAGGSKFIGLISSDLAKPPLPGCALFNTFHQGKGNLARREDRWYWIDGGFPDSVVPYYALNVNGPLKTWSLFTKGARQSSVHPLLEDKAQNYSNLNTSLFPVRIHDGLEAPLKQ